MNLNIIFFYLIVSAILYLEPVEMIAGFTFGIVWKLILMFFLFFPVFFKVLKEKQIEMFAFFSILLSFKILVSYTSLDYFSHTLTLFTKEMMFPLLYLFFIQRIEKKENLIFLVKHFSIIIILSFLPYMLGILEPFAHGYDLAEFGHSGEYGLIGVFIKPHSAAITLAFAMVIVTTHIKKENGNFENIFYIGLLLFGFYASILTYVRTGLTMYVLVIFYLYLRNINIKKIVLLAITSLFIFGIGTYMYQTNEIIQMRLNDKNKYNSNGGNGSGRLNFWKNAIENWADDEPSVIYIGLGYDYALEKMNEDVGQFIFAHNQYVQTLQQEGLIGLSFFLITLFYIYRFISKYRESQYYVTANAIFIALLIEYMFQGGFFFPMVLFLSAYLVIIKKDVEETLNKDNNE